MKHKSFGFTLVEIALFLAVTGALFVGIIAGTQNSIRAQRYNDSVQSFANFWRDIYASVSNTQNINKDNGGRSDQAIYGKLVVFGQDTGLNGEDLRNSGPKVFYYDVIGNVAKPGDSIGSNTLTALASLGANVVIVKKDGDTEEIYPSGLADSYSPTWGATIEKPKIQYSSDQWTFTGSILVVKHPRSTNINTYISNKVIEVNKVINSLGGNASTLLQEVLALSSSNANAFKDEQIDFCVNSDDIGQVRTRRQDVRLVKNANNVSSVEILSSDNANNLCTHSEGGV